MNAATCVLLLLAALGGPAAPPGEAPDPDRVRLEIENERGRVRRLVLEPRARVPLDPLEDGVVVALSDSRLRVAGAGATAEDWQLVAGEARWRPGDAVTVWNVGERTATLLSFEIARTRGRARLGPLAAPDAGLRWVVLENGTVRVVRSRVPPGARIPMHAHPARLGVCLTGIHAREIVSGGRSFEIVRERGETFFMGPVVHSVVNLEDRPFEVLEIELKRSPSPDPPSVRFLSAGGTEFALLERGRGEPLVLVHGAAGDLGTWAGAMGRLSRRYHVIAYSRRYHDPNGWDGDGTDDTLALHVRDLAALIETMRLGPVHLVGHADGGAIAAILARDRPDLVRSLVLAEPWLFTLVPSPAAETPPGARLESLVSRVRSGIEGDDPEGASRTFDDWAMGPGAFDRLPFAQRRIMLRNAATIVPGILSAERTAFRCEDALGIRAPVLLVRGERSPEPVRRAADALLRCLPAARAATIRGASHGMIVEAPRAFGRAVLDFLKRKI
ncbi:MAG: alpha/beta fold hydrolase [Acidobacteriia bacterium]|nr:alpha/beta fold hydrolase [Terriglobia bacterium]